MSIKTYSWVWAPRILGIVVAILMLIFSFRSFSTSEAMWNQVKMFIDIFIPLVILIVAIVLGWKSPLMGGILLNFTGIAYALFALSKPMLILEISVPLIIVGSLFLISFGIAKRTSQRH